MTLFSKTELQLLSAEQSSPCVSIYLPTHELGSETRQDPIRLKNQLSEAGKLLGERDFNEKQSQDLLQPAADLLEDNDFWQHQSTGLALFITSEQFRYYRVPVKFEEMAMVGEQFYTKPLIPLISDDGQFYILAGGQNEITLYQATRHSIQPVDLGTTPRSLEVALRYDDPEESLQSHTGAKAGVGSGSGQQVFSGQGGGKDSENTDILRFFQLVSDGVEKALGAQTAPLVFMGVDFLFPIYQQANKYPHLMEKAVAYQPDQLSPEEIRDRALEIVEPYFSADRKEVLEQYGSLKDKNQATDDLETILNVAYNGQIDTLIVAANTQKWGSFDAESRQISHHDEQATGSQDLLNVAVSQALATDAKVYVLDRSEVPQQADAVATLRYPIMTSQPVGA